MSYLHTDHRFILVSGRDAFDYLQNMVSNDIRDIHQNKEVVYSLLLDSKGKYKFDFFVWPYNNTDYLLETSALQIKAILKMLKFYKLRADVTLKEMIDMHVLSDLVYHKDFFIDPRISGLYRKLIQGEAPNIKNSFDFSLWRIQNGLPQYEDLKAGEDTPIEMGFDELNAITYSKGCFLGQEGTNKAKHRLVIKKRLLPFSSTSNILNDNKIVNIEQKVAGEVRTFIRGHGLGVIKLKYLDQPLYIEDTEIKVHIPDWISLPT